MKLEIIYTVDLGDDNPDDALEQLIEAKSIVTDLKDGTLELNQVVPNEGNFSSRLIATLS